MKNDIKGKNFFFEYARLSLALSFNLSRAYAEYVAFNRHTTLIWWLSTTFTGEPYKPDEEKTEA